MVLLAGMRMSLGNGALAAVLPLTDSLDILA
jgi:hypothetical protein